MADDNENFAYINYGEDGKIEAKASKSITIKVGSGSLVVKDGVISLTAKAISDEKHVSNIFDSSVSLDAIGGFSASAPDILLKSFVGMALYDSFGGFLSSYAGRACVRGSSATVQRNSMCTQISSIGDTVCAIGNMAKALTYSDDSKTDDTVKSSISAATNAVKVGFNISMKIEAITKTLDKISAKSMTTAIFTGLSYDIEVLDGLCDIAFLTAENVDDEDSDEIKDIQNKTKAILKLLDKTTVMISCLPAFTQAFTTANGASVGLGGRLGVTAAKIDSKYIKSTELKTPAKEVQ